MTAAAPFALAPWVSHRCGTNNRSYASVTSADGSPVASCSAPRNTPEAWARANANARLIAAAPDLLAALKELAGIVDGQPWRSAWPGRPHKAMDAARAAIAKAEPQ